MVAVDWDSCYADGACIEACPIHIFNGPEQNRMFQQSKWLMLQVLVVDMTMKEMEG